MISPVLIKIIYVIGIILIIGSTALYVRQFTSGAERVLYGFSAVLIGNLLWRLVCESLILLFSMHELLSSIEHETRGKKDLIEE